MPIFRGYGVHKLNYAYAVGGASVLMDTLEDNYDLTIDNYAVVDFETMADIVDIIGGVEMEVGDAEVDVLNGDPAQAWTRRTASCRAEAHTY